MAAPQRITAPDGGPARRGVRPSGDLRPPRTPRTLRGIAAIESLLAVPVLLFLGLGAVQFALVYQARHALTVALHEAARAGSVAHAAPDAIRDGLARGMLPWLHGAADLAELEANRLRARAHVAQAEAGGWLLLVRQSPTDASFADWAEPARDAFGEPIEGVREIPNDDLVHRATRALPAGGIAGRRGAEPIGAASGQTLADANLLRLRLHFGVPLSVPLAGRLLAWALRAWHGCEAPAGRTIGALRLDPPPAAAPVPHPVACTMLAPAGTDVARMPVSISATVRMQTPARDAGTAVPLASGPGLPPERGAPPGSRTGSDPTAAPPASRDAGGTPSPPTATPGGQGAASGPAREDSPPGSTSPAGGPRSEPTPSDPAFCASSVPHLTR